MSVFAWEEFRVQSGGAQNNIIMRFVFDMELYRPLCESFDLMFFMTLPNVYFLKSPPPPFFFFEMLIFYISVSKHTNQRALMVSWLIIFKLNKHGCFSSSPNSDSPVFPWEIVLHGPVERTKAKPHVSYIWALKPTIMRLNRWLVIYLVQISAPSSPSHAEGRFILILCLVFCQRFTICCKKNKVNDSVFTWLALWCYWLMATL